MITDDHAEFVQLGRRVCAVLDLPADRVTSVQISETPGHLAQVTVTLWVSSDDMSKILNPK